MAVLPILIAPHPTLKAKAKPVKEVTDAVRALLDDMLETMYDAPGIGLAANQVGSLYRVLVMDCGAREDDEQDALDDEDDAKWPATQAKVRRVTIFELCSFTSPNVQDRLLR